MTVSARIAWAEVRSRWRTLVVVALLVGLGTGGAVSLVAGARRSSTVVDRFRADRDAADIVIQTDVVDSTRLAELRADPTIASAAPYAVVFARVKGTDLDFINETESRVAIDGTYGRLLDRPVIVAGEPLDPGDPDAVQITETMALEQHLAVGDTVVLETLNARQIQETIFEGEPRPTSAGAELELTVTSIVRPTHEMLFRTPSRAILLTRALWEEIGDPIRLDQPPSGGRRVGGFDNILFARGTGGDEAAAIAAARRVFAADDELFVQRTEEEAAGILDLAGVMSVALLVGAVVVGVATIVVGVQAIGRHLAATAAQAPILASIGMTWRGRAFGVALPLFAAVLVSSAVGVATAILLSGEFPIGELGAVEPNPGIRIDAPAVAVGVLVPALVLTASVFASAARAQQIRSRTRDQRLGFSVTHGPLLPSTAIRLATGRGVPVRPALGGAILALAGVAAASTFGASLTRFVDDPARDGWPWDGEVGMADELDDDAALAVAREIAANPAVDGVLLARVGSLDVGPDGGDTQVLGLRSVEGDVALTLVDGRLPTSAGEVAIGADTARENGVSTGERLTIEGAAGPVALEVTGLVRFPVLNADNPADGLAVTLEGLATLTPPSPADGAFGYPTALATWADGVTVDEARDALAGSPVTAGSSVRSTDSTNLDKVRGLPPTLATGLAVIGALAVTHALIVAVRLQRRDLATLRTLGFVRSQVRRLVVAQSLAYGALGLVIGIPLGVVIGRWSWRVFAQRLGAADEPLTPALLVLVIPVTLLLVTVVAALPARAAGRARVAEALRAE